MCAMSLQWRYRAPQYLDNPVEQQLVNMMSGFRTKYMMFRHTPYTEREIKSVESRLHSEWLSLEARLGEWPPPFTRELWDQT